MKLKFRVDFEIEVDDESEVKLEEDLSNLQEFIDESELKVTDVQLSQEEMQLQDMYQLTTDSFRRLFEEVFGQYYSQFQEQADFSYLTESYRILDFDQDPTKGVLVMWFGGHKKEIITPDGDKIQLDSESLNGESSDTEIRKFLEDLVQELKSEGYIPRTVPPNGNTGQEPDV